MQKIRMKKYQYLINKREVGINHFNDPKAFMEYSNDMQDVYKNIQDYNPIKKRKVLIIFDDIIADMINNNKLNPIVTELFIRGRKLRFRKMYIKNLIFLLSLLHNHILKFRKMKNYNMTLIEKLQKYQHYHQVNLINMNIFLVKKYYHRINNK